MEIMPLVVPVVSAVVGAIFGAVANGLYRDRQDRKAQEKAESREREGLLRVIDSELYENNRLVERISKHPAVSDVFASQAALSTEAWRQTRVRLTQLLDADHIGVLVMHYVLVHRIEAVLKDPPEMPPKGDTQEAHAQVESLKQNRYGVMAALAYSAHVYGDRARHEGQKYIGRLPDYFSTPSEESSEEDDEQRRQEPEAPAGKKE